MKKEPSECYQPPPLKRAWKVGDILENIGAIVLILAGGYALFFLMCCLNAIATP
jgi:hypothetical protein